MSMAEKFQITIPTKEPAGEPWATFNSARCTEGCPPSGAGFKGLPTGEAEHKYPFAQGFGGNLDATGDVEAKSLEQGFRRHAMKGTDDQYSGEHVDLFYGKAVDEKGNEGFCERNNYLDRG